jgi:hypothetical protein
LIGGLNAIRFLVFLVFLGCILEIYGNIFLFTDGIEITVGRLD